MTRLLMAGLAAAVLGACASKGSVAEPTPLKKIAEQEVRGEGLWSDDIGSTSGLPGLRPLLAAGRIFVGEVGGKVRSYDADGEELWSVDTELRLSAGPALADGALIFGTLDGQAVAVDAQDGAQRWLAPLSSEVIGPPVGDADLVAVHSGDGRIYGLSPADGERLWTAERSVPPLTLRGNSPVLMDASHVYVGLDSGRVIALDRRNGELEWEEQVSEPSGRSEIERIVDVDADMLLVEPLLFVATYGGDLVALRSQSGGGVWRRSLASHSGLAFDGQCLYITDADSVLWCLDPSTGAALWSQDQLKHRALTAPLAYRGNVVVGDFEGYVHAVSSADGRIVGRYDTGSDALRVPLQAFDGRIVTLDRRGRLKLLQLEPLGGNG